MKKLGFFISISAVLLALFFAMTNKLGVWHFTTTLSGFRWAIWIALGGAIVSLMGLMMSLKQRHRMGIIFGTFGLILGISLFGMGYAFKNQAQRLPKIHDISTDLENPPTFVAVVPLREGLNSTAYEGAEIAEQQKKAYPNVQPLVIAKPAEVVFSKVLETIKKRGWEVVANDPAAGRIEATATTFWFGFKDDVVLRIQADNEAGSRIDMRSNSRVGKSDVGVNAKRIEAFLGDLKKSLE